MSKSKKPKDVSYPDMPHRPEYQWAFEAHGRWYWAAATDLERDPLKRRQGIGMNIYKN